MPVECCLILFHSITIKITKLEKALRCALFDRATSKNGNLVEEVENGNYHSGEVTDIV